MKHPTLDTLEGDVDGYDADDLEESEAREVAQALGTALDLPVEQDEYEKAVLEEEGY